MTRAERVVEAAELRGLGLEYREIARRMGISRSYAADLVRDPEGLKGRARKRSYAGECEVCGRPTDGSNGRAAASKRCQGCESRRCEDRNERIFAAWDRGETAPVIAAREGMTDTAVNSLVDHHRRGHRAPLRPLVLHRRRNRELWPVVERRWNEGATGPEIAAELGLGTQNVYEMVKRMRKLGMDLPRRIAA